MKRLLAITTALLWASACERTQQIHVVGSKPCPQGSVDMARLMAARAAWTLECQKAGGTLTSCKDTAIELYGDF